ncbi:hypothetical protein KIPB_013223, partial [Kipferlia bialata]|eukprot:g13223.t1
MSSYTLPSVIGEFPYLQGLDLGVGLNVITGQVTASPLDKLHEKSVRPAVSERSRRVLVSDEKTRKSETEIGVQASCPIPTTALKGSAGTDYKTAVECS